MVNFWGVSLRLCGLGEGQGKCTLLIEVMKWHTYHKRFRYVIWLCGCIISNFNDVFTPPSIQNIHWTDVDVNWWCVFPGTQPSPHGHENTHQLWATDFNEEGGEEGANRFGHQSRCEQQQVVVDEHVFFLRGKLLHAAHKPLWGFPSLPPYHPQQLFLQQKTQLSHTVSVSHLQQLCNTNTTLTNLSVSSLPETLFETQTHHSN